MVDDCGELGGHRVRDVEQRRRRLVDVAIENRRGVAVGGKRQPAREQLVEQRARRVHVGGRRELVTLRLLRRDVRGVPRTSPRCVASVEDPPMTLAMPRSVTFNVPSPEKT